MFNMVDVHKDFIKPKKKRNNGLTQDVFFFSYFKQKVKGYYMLIQMFVNVSFLLLKFIMLMKLVLLKVQK